jgi:dTDP-4-amino-4,6-dideoxygalactose transaminase
MLRNHGGKVKYQHSCHGGNFRLDTIQAALLLAKLPYLDTWINNRVATAEIYSDCFYSLIDERDCPRKGIFTVTCPESKPLDFCTYNQYVIRVESDTRDDLVKYLNGHNVPTAIYYPLCLSEQPCYRGVNFECDCVGSKLAARQNIALPIAHLTTDEIELVTSTIRKFYE